MNLSKIGRALVGTAAAAAMTAAAAVLFVACSQPTKADRLPPEIEAYYGKVASLAHERGWACVSVDATGEKGAFAYSVGLSSKGLPELLLNGMSDGKKMCQVVSGVARRLTARGKPVDDGFELSAPGKLRLNNIYPGEFFAKCPFARLWAERHNIRDATGMQMVAADGR